MQPGRRSDFCAILKILFKAMIDMAVDNETKEKLTKELSYGSHCCVDAELVVSYLSKTVEWGIYENTQKLKENPLKLNSMLETFMFMFVY